MNKGVIDKVGRRQFVKAMDPHSYKWITELAEHKSDHLQLVAPRSGILRGQQWTQTDIHIPRNGTPPCMLIGPIMILMST